MYPKFIQLMDDEIVSLVGLTLSDCKPVVQRKT